jgi:MinD-like ATPase involved in chromosome partitioning or flagellar assembly
VNDWQGGSYERRQSAAHELLEQSGHLPHSSTPASAEPPADLADAKEGPGPPSIPPNRADMKQTSTGVSDRTTRPSYGDLATATSGDQRPVASEGWRRRIRSATFGLVKLGPGREELSRLEDERDAGLQLSRPTTVLIANQKGSAGKTPVTALLAAVLGAHRGGGVVAWDNNENQGTLGLRTAEGRFPTTAVDLLDSAELFETGRGGTGELGRFMRHQQVGKFDVLASAEDSRSMRMIGHEEFTRLHAILSRFYQLIVVDTGNSLLAPNWTAAADTADVLVIPLRWSYDHVRCAQQMIMQLHEMGRDDLVRNAVTVISHVRGAAVDRENASKWRTWFEENTAAVLEIPYDPHIDAGSRLSFDRLAAPTQRAFLRLGATVSRTLASIDNPYLTASPTTEGN